jgi:hypothetical protein
LNNQFEHNGLKGYSIDKVINHTSFVKLSKKEDSDMQDCSVLKKMSSCDISDHTTSTNITGLEGISGDGSASRAAEVP